MTYTIVILDSKEQFLEYIDTSRCTVKESHKTGGLRTLELEYKFKDFANAKELFKQGNKVWVSNDINISDCLYVINTKVKQDIYKENSFTIELEEVLVELNYVPLFFQTELTTENGFRLRTSNNQAQVQVDYNALKYWFGDYFNLGVVQDCLSDTASWVTITGSLTRMSLLRMIEEETGNIFITRYEKDCLNNTIHRYLDFLNPINASKNWTLNIEYDFVNQSSNVCIYDSQGNLTDTDNPWEVKRYIDTIPAGSLVESVSSGSEDTGTYEKGTLDTNWKWNATDESVEDYNASNDYTPITNLNPNHVNLRITDGTNLLNSDGEIYSNEDNTQTPLEWTSTDIGFSSTTNNSPTKAVITLCKFRNNIGVLVNEKSFIITDTVGSDINGHIALETDDNYTNNIANNIINDNTVANITFPDDCYLELYDFVNDKVLFRTQINRQIGTVHEEVLDFDFNMENVEFEIDESNTYSAITPVIQQDTSNANSLSREDTAGLITLWKGLEVKKGDIIPMIVERSYATAPSWTRAIHDVLGVYHATPEPGKPVWDVSTNWWWKPFKQNNQINESDSSQNKYEAWRATAYWQAPFDKKAEEMYVALPDTDNINYNYIEGRPDSRQERHVSTPKMGTVNTSDETVYAIYNQVALYLKEHSVPDVDVEVDVATLHDNEYNNYEIYDKVYIKLPDTREIITARVIETKKEPNNPSTNTVKLSNYTIKTFRTLQNQTIINAENTSFTYPETKEFTVQLENKDYDSNDSYSIQYLANKLVSLSLYKIENGSSTWAGKTYTKRTDAYGRCSIVMDYDPSDYELKITFKGDEEYTESSMTIKINVSGVKEVVTATHTAPLPWNVETTSQTTYYDKYGRSPDKTKILAIGRISAGRDSGSYANFYETEFKNWCPHCGKATLMWGIFYAGNETSNWGTFPGTGRKEGGSAEGHIFCSNCDADYSCQGYEHVSNGKRLSVTKATKLSTKAKAYELRNGKRVYEVKTVVVESKNVSNSSSTSRKMLGSVSSDVRNKALSIVGNKTGMEAAKAIASWMDKNIWYQQYSNFNKSASSVLSSKRGNCCDQTRLYLEMCDVAGCSEFFKMEYIHVYNHVYAGMTAKSTNKYYTVDCASDSYGAWGYVCQGYRTAILHRTVYPKRPF